MPLFQHAGQHRPAEEHYAVDIDVHCAAPLIIVHILQEAVCVDARDIYQDVHPAAGLDALFHGALYLVFPGGVAGAGDQAVQVFLPEPLLQSF